MITVKGFRYYNDNHCPRIDSRYENLGQLAYHIKQTALGKSRIKFPAQNSDGTFDQNFAGSFSGHLSYADEQRHNDGDISTHIELIQDDSNGKILFSSGSLTDKKGHISTTMNEMLENLKTWAKAEYDFAD